MQHSVLKLATVLICFSFFSCKKNISEFSFYYWKTKFEISPTEKSMLADLKCKTIYTRFFDVDIDEEAREPFPVGIINGLDSISQNINIIPVVFITNRTFLNSGKTDISKLAQNIIKEINALKDNYSELQFDCDWSGKTKENYFSFLQEIRKLISKNVKLTCTIRLHQVKYAFKSGIPPVDRGTLMFYNMGNVHDQNEVNSIYDQKNAKKYTGFIKGYKLPLDAALPVFAWYVHYRNDALIGLISEKDMPIINDTNIFLRFKNSSIENGDREIDSKNNAKFKVITDHLANGIFYKTNDVLKLETLNDQQLIEAAELLNTNLKEEDRRIIFFAFDEDNIKKYDKETFTKIRTIFN